MKKKTEAKNSQFEFQERLRQRHKILHIYKNNINDIKVCE